MINMMETKVVKKTANKNRRLSKAGTEFKKLYRKRKRKGK